MEWVETRIKCRKIVHFVSSRNKSFLSVAAPLFTERRRLPSLLFPYEARRGERKCNLFISNCGTLIKLDNVIMPLTTCSTTFCTCSSSFGGFPLIRFPSLNLLLQTEGGEGSPSTSPNSYSIQRPEIKRKKHTKLERARER